MSSEIWIIYKCDYHSNKVYNVITKIRAASRQSVMSIEWETPGIPQ